MRKAKARKYYYAELRVGAAAALRQTRKRRWYWLCIIDVLLFKLVSEFEVIDKHYKVETVYK